MVSRLDSISGSRLLCRLWADTEPQMFCYVNIRLYRNSISSGSSNTDVGYCSQTEWDGARERASTQNDWFCFLRTAASTDQTYCFHSLQEKSCLETALSFFRGGGVAMLPQATTLTQGGALEFTGDHFPKAR